MNIWMLLYVSCYVFITNLSYILTFPQKRQKGGIGSAAYDPKQKDIRAFFGGATVSADSTANSSDNSKTEQVDEHLIEGRAASNVFDETEPSSESRL